MGEETHEMGSGFQWSVRNQSSITIPAPINAPSLLMTVIITTVLSVRLKATFYGTVKTCNNMVVCW